jgi:hypothetical protein
LDQTKYIQCETDVKLGAKRVSEYWMGATGTKKAVPGMMMMSLATIRLGPRNKRKSLTTVAAMSSGRQPQLKITSNDGEHKKNTKLK